MTEAHDNANLQSLKAIRECVSIACTETRLAAQKLQRLMKQQTSRSSQGFYEEKRLLAICLNCLEDLQELDDLLRLKTGESGSNSERSKGVTLDQESH